jgi:LPXTG-site transpeptidase (sortase) family protein
MTMPGTVVITVAADAAHDAAGNGNTASSNIDNTVTFTLLGITSPNNVTFVAGNPSSFTVTTVGAPPPTLSYTGTLPSGIGFVDNGDGTATLSGMPAFSSVGTYNLTFTAHIAGVAPDATQNFTLSINGPPGVSLINSSADTGDGQILENEHTGVALTQLLVVFNKDMQHIDPADPGDVQRPLNYTLIRDGSTTITIDSVSYNPATYTATLNINGGAPLPDSRYTLTVEGDIEDTLGAPIGTDFVRHFYVDNAAPTLTSAITVQGGAAIVNGATINVRFSGIDVTFNEDVNNPALDTHPDDVTNPQNYLLLTPGPNGIFDTPSCGSGLTSDDVQIPTGPVTYNNHGASGPFVATVRLNNGTSLPNGLYRLFVCGTTSIVDLAGNALNNGADAQLTFTVLVLDSVKSSPRTGFAPGVVTVLPEQPADKAYADLGNLWIEIPKLNLKTGITGVPLQADGWDVTWLNWQVGWLEGTAYPTWAGNTVLTAHGYTADGEAGPFALLKDLRYGETVTIHLGGMKYTYAVRSNLLVGPNDTRLLTRHETLDWITLITCQQYDARTKSYLYRRVVRAVLIRAEPE